MNHADHVNLLRGGVPAVEAESAAVPVWADLGAGTGAFTLALADLLGPSALIYAVDQDSSALSNHRRAMRTHFPDVSVRYLNGDFTKPLDLPPLDGIVLANALHFVPAAHRDATVQRVKGYLKPGGRFILVEYDTDHGNLWVPHPMTYVTWERVAQRNGLRNTRLLATVPSRFLGRIYSALSLVD